MFPTRLATSFRTLERLPSRAPAGVSCEKEPTYNPTYDIDHAFYRDPDGYLVEVQRFRQAEWPRPGE